MNVSYAQNHPEFLLMRMKVEQVTLEFLRDIETFSDTEGKLIFYLAKMIYE